MLTKKRYSALDMALWTRREALGLIVYAAAITVLFDVLDFSFISSPPWTPIALVGTAVAFVIVFKNESAYGGMWKACKIWEGIVNTSKTWGMKTIAMVTTNKMESPVSEEAAFRENKTIIHIHVGRITALRYRITSLENELYAGLSDEQRVHLIDYKNKV